MGNGDPGLRTLLVGIDAGCHTVLDRLDEEDVGTLRSILDDGASAPLRSQLPPWTPSAWPSLYTGMNPGKHGVFDFLRFDGYDWDVVNASDVMERPVWEVLDRYGYASVVVNVPVTHPPRPFDGALVPGYMAPEEPTCHPEGLFEDLVAELGAYRVYPEDTEDASGYVEAVASRGEAFRYLAERFDPDFGFLQFQATDTVFHDRPGDWQAIREVYRRVDGELERTLRECDPDTVVLASDHGIGPLDGVEFRANEFLAERGDVARTASGTGMPTWATAREERLKTGDDGGTDSRQRSFTQRVGAVAARLGLTSQRVGRVLERVGLADPVASRLPPSLVHAGTEQVDFPASRAYMRSRTECGIRLNLAGREPDGTVPAAEYEAVRDDLMAALRGVETPDGDRLFESVLPREDVFDGPHVDRAVDVVTVPDGFDHFLSAELRGSTFGPPSEPWNHKLAGLLAVAGRGVAADEPLTDPTLFDVAPTVLATFDVPADERMDGRCLPVVEAAGRHSYPRPDRDDRTDTDATAVERRLADLGYLE